jgi:hypothetical protein
MKDVYKNSVTFGRGMNLCCGGDRVGHSKLLRMIACQYVSPKNMTFLFLKK